MTATNRRTPTGLPVGYRVLLEESVTRLDDGRVLVGGSPVGLVRLGPAIADQLVTTPQGTHLDVTDAATAAVADRLLARNLAQPDVSGLPPAQPADLTVVVPVRDRPGQLDRCLAALRPLPCVVVDDASQDPDAVASVAAAHGAELLALPENLGPAGARNAGLAKVSTPYVALVDSDVEVNGAALLAACRHFADPSVALVGPRVAGTVRTPRPRWFQRFDARNSSLDQGTRPVALAHGASVSWLPSACLVARTAALGKGFDPSLRVGEDVDLVWRLLAAGHRVRYAPEVVAWHDVRGSLSSWLGRLTAYGTSGAALAERHGSAVAPAAFTPLQGLAAFAVLARSRAALPLLAVAGTATLRRVRPAMPPGAEGAGVATRLTAQSLGSAVHQATALTLRHWWPLAAAGLATRTGRRTVATALALDAVTTLARHRDVATYAEQWAGQRLSDLAYGLGLWGGAVRARSSSALACQVPRFPGRSATGAAPRAAHDTRR